MHLLPRAQLTLGIAPLYVVESEGQRRADSASPGSRSLIFPSPSRLRASVRVRAAHVCAWVHGYVSACVRTCVRAYPCSAGEKHFHSRFFPMPSNSLSSKKALIVVASNYQRSVQHAFVSLVFPFLDHVRNLSFRPGIGHRSKSTGATEGRGRE